LGIFVTVWILSLALTFVWSENTGKEITHRAIIISTIIAAVIRFLIFSLSSIDLIEVISIIIAIPCVLLIRLPERDDQKIKEKAEENLIKAKQYLDEHFDEIIYKFYLTGEIKQRITKEEIHKALQKNDLFKEILKAVMQESERHSNLLSFNKFSAKRIAKLAILLATLEITKTSYFYEYKYDDKGNMIEEIEKNADGQIISLTKYEYKYDDKGNMIEEIRKNESGRIIEYKYDSKGNMIEKNESGGIIEHKYDDKGNMIEEIRKSEWEGIIEHKYYKYDNKGNIIEEMWRDRLGETIDFIEYKYDDKNNKIGEIWTGIKKEIFSIGSVNAFLVEYKYDDKGNMIERRCTSLYCRTF